ncbi:hypothetical protein ACFDR9_002072 [Janthinobacterium sp. CG_23.3]|uniref:hypothetical protein n=1 Tax=Janthinobacterium sp. CG_23.3 TaxID=3349634 RepID=UPI0038D47024
MQAIEKRVAALEAKANEGNSSFKLVMVAHGETHDQAMTREGFAPDAADVLCVVFVSPTDARL